MQELLLKQGNEFFRQGAYDNARECYERILSVTKNNLLRSIALFNIKLLEKRLEKTSLCYRSIFDDENLRLMITNNEIYGIVLNKPENHKTQCEVILSSGLFFLEWYVNKYPDMQYQDALLHYCTFGYKEGRNINPLFDEVWYLQQYLNSNMDINPIVHYILRGWKIGYNPSLKFDGNKYINDYPHVVFHENPLSHFYKAGRHIGYSFDSVKVSNKKNVKVSNKLIPYLSFITQFKPRQLDKDTDDKTFSSKSLDIHFVIPDFSKGGGGHMTIFRIIKWLEFFGHRVTVWILNPVIHKTAEKAYEDIIKYYQTVKCSVFLINDDSMINSKGDIIVATSWETVWPVVAVSKFKKRFYLVQDYEPLFYPKGSKQVLAEMTYKNDIDCICAGQWLMSLMKDKFGRYADYFDLAVDSEHYFYQKNKINGIPRICFYSRIFTERRGVEIGLLAFDILANEGLDFHVDFFGSDLKVDEAPYSFKVHGVVDPSYLGELYRECDIGLCFSLTNHSLVPKEMMACGLPVIEYDGENNKSVYPEDVVLYSSGDPYELAEKIKILLTSKDLRNHLSEKALKWAQSFSWELSARKIENVLINRLLDAGYRDITHIRSGNRTEIYVSIIIPTLNGGDKLRQCISLIKNQKVPWRYEIIIVDSESTDGVIDDYCNEEVVRVFSIKRNEFRHGITRNYGASLAKGEFLVFLTQDSLPANQWWLYNLVTIMEHYPNAAGAFGRHIAHDDASFFTKQEIDNHFSSFLHMPLCVSKKTDPELFLTSEEWRQKLHYFSNNCSCIRKSVFKLIPFRDVKYGEDQLWAWDVINAGYDKVYAVTAIVKHSHEYNPPVVYERSKVDGAYFKHYFGYILVKSEVDLQNIFEKFCLDIDIKSFENHLSATECDLYKKKIRARLEGLLAGACDCSLFSDDNSLPCPF